MATDKTIEPVLHPIPIKQLRPTQFTVGMREVHAKQREWRQRPRDKAGVFLGGHMIPAVIGPDGHPWLIDHHHLALALHKEGAEDVLVSVVARLDHLPKKRFLAFMDAHNWLHPYDEHGARRDFADLPHDLDALVDDPWRSLAGELRHAGGYAKSPVPYTEFLWADLLRDHIERHQIEHDFSKALDHALALARAPLARHLPGWAGAED